MPLDDVFNELAQEVFPDVANEVFPDSLKVIRPTETVDSAGRLDTTEDTIFDYEDTVVPCTYEPINGQKFDGAGRLISTEAYVVTMPTHLNGERIDVRSADILEIQARGHESVKTMRIVSIADQMGVVLECNCVKEN